MIKTTERRAKRRKFHEGEAGHAMSGSVGGTGSRFDNPMRAPGPQEIFSNLKVRRVDVDMYIACIYLL